MVPTIKVLTISWGREVCTIAGECWAIQEARGHESLKMESGKTPKRRCCLILCKGATGGGKECAKLQEQHVGGRGRSTASVRRERG